MEERGQGCQLEHLELLNRLFCRAFLKGVWEQPLHQQDGLTTVQLACLHYVQRHRSASVSQVADGLAISRAAATNLVERLGRKGLVVREENPEDRRQVLIRLSPKGEELLAVIITRQRENLRKIIGVMSPKDVRALEQGVKAFLEAAILETDIARETCVRCGVEHSTGCPLGLILDELQMDLKY